MAEQLHMLSSGDASQQGKGYEGIQPIDWGEWLLVMTPFDLAMHPSSDALFRRVYVFLQQLHIKKPRADARKGSCSML